MLHYLAAQRRPGTSGTPCAHTVVRVHKYSSLGLHEWLTYSITGSGMCNANCADGVLSIVKVDQFVLLFVYMVPGA